MAHRRCPRLRPKNPQWLSDPVLVETTIVQTHSGRIAQFRHKAHTRNGHASKGVAEDGSTRTSTHESGFSLPDVSGAEERRDPSSHHQSESAEQFCAREKVFSDLPLQSARLLATRRLYDKSRSRACILSYTSCKDPSPLSACRIQRSMSADDVFAPGLKQFPSNFCSNNQLDRRDPSKEGHSSYCLFGRFSPGSSGPRNSPTADNNGVGFLTVARLDHQHKEMCPPADTEDRISGSAMEHWTQSEVVNQEQVPVDMEVLAKHYDKEEMVPEGGAEHPRTAELCSVCGSQGSLALQTDAAAVTCHGKAPTPEEGTCKPCSTGRFRLVEAQCEYAFPYSFPQSMPLHCDRRSRQRVGGTGRRHSTLGLLDTTANQMAQQPERNVCYSPCIEVPESQFEQFYLSHSIGQQNSTGISTQRRRYQISEPPSVDVSDPRSSGCAQYKDGSVLPPRTIQRTRRSSFPRELITRMAPSTSSDRPDMPLMGQTHGGPICIQESSCCKQLRMHRPHRHSSPISQCFQQDLVLPTGMGISTALLDTQSPGTSEQVCRYLPIGSTEVAQGVLVARPPVESTSSTFANNQPTRQPGGYVDRSSSSSDSKTGNGSMEDWGWRGALNEWSEHERGLLNAGWRSSTVTAYKLAWKRWGQWCVRNRVDITDPSGSQLARFLANLKLKEGLAPSTIALHKSAISTLTNPECESLSNHTLVKQVMKGIVNTSRKKKVLPIWDPRQVSIWLKENPPETVTLFEASRRCAVILLLASGRRVHDLTLLRNTPDNLVDNGDHIILWPAFGSKTDSATRQQSGWKLNASSDQAIDPVYWLRKVCSLSRVRRHESNFIPNLFISTTGLPKPASRTIIGGWVKTVLKSAGIEKSAGSTRSAVASLSWLEGCPIERILERGNWKSENTFAKYYRREVMEGGNSSTFLSLTNLFEPITSHN